MANRKPEGPTFPVRFVTATTLFDGHDASINVFRRILAASGAEVIHLGHNRTATDIVDTAVQEDAQAIAVTCYQGGHMEFFRFLHHLTVEQGRGRIRIFGGGGGTILPEEGRQLQAEGITRIYSPDDGRSMGLQGMVDDMIRRADYPTGELDNFKVDRLQASDHGMLARVISASENYPDKYADVFEEIAQAARRRTAPPVIGVTGTGGSGKSSLVDELLRRYLSDFGDHRVAVLSVDPSQRRTGGALLGDRIRMNSIPHPHVYMRSLATRQSSASLPDAVNLALSAFRAAGLSLIILETSGIGQADTSVVDLADLSLYVMTPEYGAATQLEKIGMLDYADLVAVNKGDKQGAEDALRDVRRQVRRNRLAFNDPDPIQDVYLTVASDFNDPGVDLLYRALVGALRLTVATSPREPSPTGRRPVIPPERSGYLAQIAETVRQYNRMTLDQSETARRLYQLEGSRVLLEENDPDGPASLALSEAIDASAAQLSPEHRMALDTWEDMTSPYRRTQYSYQVRGREIKVPLRSSTLSDTPVPKVALPRYRDWGDRLRWLLQENLPGRFPYTAGVYPFKRTTEDPTRMFAGEGPPEQTNQRFHYLCSGTRQRRLSTAFDSVTLYGEDPGERPDIYGKVGNSGVSISTLDDVKRLYSGFDLCDPSTSVSMTINGPAPMILALFMNAAIDQQCELYIRRHELTGQVEKELARKRADRPRYLGPLPEGNDGLGLLLLGTTGDQVLEPDVYRRIRAETLSQVRGTVQADILKEDQAQNTCIFSIDFALKMMGDIQQFFVDNGVRNFYSVSVSGYHMAEAGANPITQLAFTLANGFTYVEHYLSRGMDINEFAPNLSFFFSNGLDPEYAVIGRVARRIWAKVLRDRYGANARSQMLKYHIQTSGRSLHAQEVEFNDIRTTLQALYAVYDNCNSLHTNAYDEALTTPTEESVRRAVAIQLIVNRELGLARNENPLQGSFVIEELTDLVEEAVLAEFTRLNLSGGVLGAMERQYQRSKIQEESLYYERVKESGEYPLIGVNTFLSESGSPFITPDLLVRSTDEEKNRRIREVADFKSAHARRARPALLSLASAARAGDNVFVHLMETAKSATLGQMVSTLYQVGGRYRRNM